jgi:hypothetical protein
MLKRVIAQILRLILWKPFQYRFQTVLSGPLFDHSAMKDYDRSVQFGKDISEGIYNWSTTDGDKGYLSPTSPSYIPPVGPGLWVPQTGQAANNPFWKQQNIHQRHCNQYPADRHPLIQLIRDLKCIRRS